MKIRLVFAVLALVSLGFSAWTHSELVGILTGLLMGGALLIKERKKANNKGQQLPPHPDLYRQLLAKAQAWRKEDRPKTRFELRKAIDNFEPKGTARSEVTANAIKREAGQ